MKQYLLIWCFVSSSITVVFFVRCHFIAVNGKRIKEVQLVMAAYLFDFSSALCIGGNNVSQSAGFESIAHTYHR